MKIVPLLAASLAISLGAADLAIAQPAPSADAAQNPAVKSPNAMTGAPLAKGHNSFTKGQARDRIRKAGYADVHDLSLDSDGLWQAHATQNGQPVNVALDYKGDVATQ